LNTIAKTFSIATQSPS